MSQISLLSFAVCALLFLTQPLRADTIVLKSGEKVEGKVVNETDAELTVSVAVSASIKDERVIKKADIERIEKVKADEVAWAALAGVEPGQDSLENDEYLRVIAALEYFIASHADSPRAATAKERLGKFQEEQRRVESGQIKMDGEWLTKERVEEERIQIGGRILFNRMRRYAAGGRPIEVMATFDLLEKNFGGSADYPNAVALARQILPSLKISVEQAKEHLKRRTEENKVRLKTAQGDERKQLEGMLARDKAKAEAAVAAAEKSKVKWLPLQPATERSLSALQSRINTDSTRLDAMALEKMTQSVALAESAEKDMHAGKMTEAESALNEATSLWSANEIAQRMKKKLTAAKGGKDKEEAAKQKPRTLEDRLLGR
jgi:hypothetical protein